MTILSNLTGFYVLTAKGELGSYGPDKTFSIDARLTKAFSNHNSKFLQAYLQQAANDYFRIAIIYQSNDIKPWGSETMVLEETVIREVYPIGGRGGGELTSFQKKNRAKSIYRGMELLLEYENETHPGVPVYCPVIFDKNSTLVDYPATLGKGELEGENETPVLEILNLVAPVPFAKRKNSAIQELKQTIHKGTVKKGKRKTSRLELLNEVGVGGERGDAADAYSDVDKRADREVIVSEVQRAQQAMNAMWVDPYETDLYKKLERWLERPPEPPDPELLKKFVTFQDLDDEPLSLLAENSLIYFVPAGAPLLERGKTDDWNLYVVEGKVELIADDGIQKFIESGTENAKNPISFLRPRKYTVTAYCRVSFIWIHDAVVNEVRKNAPPPKRDIARKDVLLKKK